MSLRFTDQSTLLDRTYPFHFRCNEQGKVEVLGRSLRKLIPDWTGEETLHELFNVNAPKIQDLSTELPTLDGKSCELKIRSSEVPLCGQLLVDENKLIFLCTPRFQDLGDLTKYGLGAHDFAPHDASLENVFVRHAHRTQLVDLQKMVRRVEDASRREKKQEQLLEASRLAGMAEIATSVLHNVGNVLNSVNISASVIRESLNHDSLNGLSNLVSLIEQQGDHLADFIREDKRGKIIPIYLGRLSQKLNQENDMARSELEGLLKNIDHIKQIVNLQQSYSQACGVHQEVRLPETIEDSITAVQKSLENNRIEVIRQFDDVPPLLTEKHKVLQILVNLLSNARDAIRDCCSEIPQIKIRTYHREGQVFISIRDNGIGIARENLNRVFNYGFTTKKDGHGFGLHSSANAATELGGSLSVTSDGPKLGTTFTLALPIIHQHSQVQREKA